MKTTVFFARDDANQDWHVVDARNQVLGRLATRVASVLRGKHKPTYTPNADIGDFVIVGDYMGVIERFGIKTTRISSLGGEQIVVSNKDLTDSRVRNYKRMAKRRVVFRLGVTYQTPAALLREIPGVVTDIFREITGTTLDRVHFFSYGDFSLIYEIVYYVDGNDYTRYMDLQQMANLRIYEEFEKRKIEFAYPTQTLYVTKA